jgi:hypothetical protein
MSDSTRTERVNNAVAQLSTMEARVAFRKLAEEYENLGVFWGKDKAILECDAYSITIES